MTISSWPLNERPREKLLNLGAKSLSDAELLAIFFRTGVPGKTALDLARELLKEFGDLKKLLSAESPAFFQKSGVGTAKFAILKAAIELGRRYHQYNIAKGEKLSNSEITTRFLVNHLQYYDHEVFACLFLDNQNNLLGFEELFKGSIHQATIYPREVVKKCLAYNAAKIILAHNHPSGNPYPSPADRELTASLKTLLDWLDVQLVDHIIIGSQENFSFAEMGLIG